MDIKSYILLGGGVLLVIVLLHGLWTAWRGHRRNVEEHEEAIETAGVGSEEDPEVASNEAEPDLWEDSEDTTAPPMLMERIEAGPVAPRDPAEEAVEEVVPDEGVSEQAAGADVEEDGAKPGRRIQIPGKRTEPTIPRAQRLADPPWNTRATKSNGSPEDDDLVVIWIVAKPEEAFDGDALLEALVSNGLECGVDRVFRKFDPHTSGPWFTVANGIEPGTFELSDPAAMATPAVVLLLPLPGIRDPAGAFEDMLEIAQNIGIALGGEIKDEQRNVMSAQTIEHYRQRVREFKRKSLRT